MNKWNAEKRVRSERNAKWKGNEKMYDSNVLKGHLEKLKNSGTLVTVHMKNGFPMRGKIARYDDRVIVLNDYGVEKLLYQGAVSTVSPSAPPCQHFADAQYGAVKPRDSYPL